MPYVAAVTTAAQSIGLAAQLLLAVCHTETRLTNVVTPNDGATPSYGICQVKLATAQQFIPGISAHQLMNPGTNALVAGLYLRHQIRRYRNESCGITAYNRGSVNCAARVDRTYNSTYFNKVKTTLRTQAWMQ